MTSLTFVKKALMAATGATVVSLVGGEAAQAVTFDFSGSPNSAVSSRSFLEDGINLTATGFDDNNNDRLVSQRFGGLGVTTGPGEQNELDGFGSDETLQLAFDQKISLVSATFSRVGFNDDFQVFVDGDLLVSADIQGGNFNFLDSGIGSFNFTSFALPDRTGSVLEFTVAGNNDDYLLRSIEVEPVPEPLTILGSLSALGMGTLLKKQQKKS